MPARTDGRANQTLASMPQRLRGVAPPEVTTRDIYRGIVPFVAIQVAAVFVVFFFPGIATWLPKAIGW